MAPCSSISTMTTPAVVVESPPCLSLLRLEDLATAASTCKRLPPTTSPLESSLAALPHHHHQEERPTKKRRKQVSFAESSSTDIHTMEPHSQETWYSADDYATFEADVRSAIRILRSNESTTVDLCIRGLEKYRTFQLHEAKKIRETCHLVAILQEQERQRSKRVRNLNAFRLLSRQNSKWSREIAIQQAILDAKEVGSYTNVAENDTDTEDDYESDFSSDTS